MIKKPKITLQAWAAASFDPPPKLPTLRAWARAGKIQPAPIKVGRDWMVEQDAEYRQSNVPTQTVADLSSRALAILQAG